MGVKVTLSESVPTAGIRVGVVQVNVPGTGLPLKVAVPPVNPDEEQATA